MRPDNINLQSMVDTLQGTCDTMQGALDDLYPDMDESELTVEDWQFIENEIFLCATCGWWHEVCEMSEEDEGEQVCSHCSESEDEE